MALPVSLVAPFVIENTNAPGTGTVTLGGPPSDRVSFGVAFASGTTVYYFLDDQTQSEWGIGTFTNPGGGNPGTISRDMVIGNTSGTVARLNFGGAALIYSQIPGSRIATYDESGLIRGTNRAFAVNDSSGNQAYATSNKSAVTIFSKNYNLNPNSAMFTYDCSLSLNNANSGDVVQVSLKLFILNSAGTGVGSATKNVSAGGPFPVVPFSISVGSSGLTAGKYTALVNSTVVVTTNSNCGIAFAEMNLTYINAT